MDRLSQLEVLARPLTLSNGVCGHCRGQWLTGEDSSYSIIARIGCMFGKT